MRTCELYYADLIGKPFREFGRGPDFYDCYGIVLEVARRGGMILPDYGSLACGIGRANARTIEAHRDEYERVDSPRALDLVLMWNADPTLLNHLGIMVGPHYLVHTELISGCVCARADDPFIRYRIEGFYRWRG